MSAQLDKLAKRLEAIPKAVRDALQPALAASGEELVHRMKGFAPEDTGALKESITITTAGNRTPAYSQPGGATVVPENAVLVTAGNEKVRYAHLPEFGTKDAAAQPYFWPSFRLLRKRIENRLKRAVSKAVKESWNK